MNAIHAIIIEDEPDSVSLLQLQLKKHCPAISVIRSFLSPAEALDELPLIKPDIVFLDVEMPGLSGFELLERLQPIHFKVIFITAYNQYATKAFRFNALDYLLKPVASNDLISAVTKALRSNAPGSAQLDNLRRQMNGEPPSKLAVSSHSGIMFIELNDIIYAEASGNYSRLVMKEGAVHIISKTLKDIQGILEEKSFFRIHRQYIINLNKVKQFNRTDSLLTMENKAELPVARIQKEKLEEKFDWL